MCKDACMEMCICESLWSSPAIVCMRVRDCVQCSSFLVLLCVWLCAQTCWLVADNDTRGRVFVDLLAEEIPTVLSVSGLCVFLRLHAWLRQLFYSPVGPLNPTRPSSLADPSFPLRPALHLIRAALAKPSAELLRAPQSCTMLTIHPSFPSTLTPFTCENTGSYLQFTGAMAHRPRECACWYMCAQKWPWERAAWVNTCAAKSIFMSLLELYISSYFQ